MTERLLITGVSGFIGQHLVEALSGRFEIHGVYESPASRLKNPQLPDGQQHLCDLKDAAAVERVVADVDPHFVLHLAAKSEVALSFSNYLEVTDVNYKGTVALAEACRKHAPSLKLFVMASTMETYGHQDPADGPFTEDTEQRPMAPYAVAKLACEKYLAYMRYAYEFPFTILRQTNAYGRRDNDFFVVERIITQMLAGDVCNLGEPDPVRNFLWIGDLMELYSRILSAPELAVGETFVTGPDNGLTIRDLAHQIRAKLDWQGTINWHTIPKRPGEIYYLNSRADKAERVLGWTPKVGLSEGLDRTIAIWRDR